MSAKRQEKDDFLDAMQGVQPLTNNDKVTAPKSKASLAQRLKRKALEQQSNEQHSQLSLSLQQVLDPYDQISYKQDGVQHGVFKQLRLGQYQIEGVVNLQAMSIEQALDELLVQLEEYHKRGIRCLLLQHGLGLQAKPVPGKLRSYLYQWLPQLTPVIALHSAQKVHGGLGATYVLLKKNNQQKLLNREKHKKG